MIYNCYVKKNKYIVDVATSDDEIVTKKYAFRMPVGFIGELPYGCKEDDNEFTEIYRNVKLKTTTFDNYLRYLSTMKDIKNNTMNPRLVFGEIDPIYHCLTTHFKEPLRVYNPKFFTIDIEVYCKSGFPEPKKAEYVIDLITIADYQNKKYYTWGLKEFTGDFGGFDVEYTYCKSEVRLLESVIDFLEIYEVKCLTGWNSDGFDIPYIINRMSKLEGQSEIINNFIKEDVNKYGRDKSFITMQSIDYMELYKYFKPYKLERYKLDFVSKHEGFEGKLAYKGKLYELSDDNWNEYVMYNIIDNYVIIQLESKLKYMKLAFSMANDNKCLPKDIFSSVKMWDCALYFELYHNRKALPPPKSTVAKNMSLVGGWCGTPITNGFQHFTSVFDISSSYPHQIMQFNISPETLVRKPSPDLKNLRERFKPSLQEMMRCPEKQFNKEFKGFMKALTKKGIDIDSVGDEELNIYRTKYNIWRFSSMLPEDFDFVDILKKHNVTMTPNLQFYRKDVVGVIPHLMKKFFAIRNMAKRNQELLEYYIETIETKLGKTNKKKEIEIIEIEDEDEII